MRLHQIHIGESLTEHPIFITYISSSLSPDGRQKQWITGPMVHKPKSTTGSSAASDQSGDLVQPKPKQDHEYVRKRPVRWSFEAELARRLEDTRDHLCYRH